MLDEILAAVDADDVVLVSNSLEATVVLAANSPPITARVLASPAGFIRLGLDPELALTSNYSPVAPSCRVPSESEHDGCCRPIDWHRPCGEP